MYTVLSEVYSQLQSPKDISQLTKQGPKGVKNWKQLYFSSPGRGSQNGRSASQSNEVGATVPALVGEHVNGRGVGARTGGAWWLCSLAFAVLISQSARELQLPLRAGLGCGGVDLAADHA